VRGVLHVGTFCMYGDDGGEAILCKMQINFQNKFVITE
jgi:hypothetical protein